jgi:hypothetical protein
VTIDLSDPITAVQPENALERRVCVDPEWQVGMLWGKPRDGHPEGSVGVHTVDVLANVDRVAIDQSGRARLRFIALVHDAFKYRVDPCAPKTGENHHAMRARRFAERFITDGEALDVIELHDDAYLSWRDGDRGDWAEAERRALALIARLGPALGLYLRFYTADNSTAGKSSEHREWFVALTAR